MDRRTWRGVWVLAVAMLAAGTLAITPATAGKFLTKKKAKKLFYTKVQADSRFLDRAEGDAAYLDKAEGDAAYLDPAEGDARYVGKGETRTGYFSCRGAAWQEATSSTTFYILFGRRHVDTGDGLFLCPAALPHGATVIDVRFTVTDTSASERVVCGMARVDLIAGTDFELMASAFTTLGGTPGTLRVTDSSISNPVIDNDTYAYDVSCLIEGNGDDVGFLGGSVEYTLTGDQGAAS